jgi:hypothetical protein
VQFCTDRGFPVRVVWVTNNSRISGSASTRLPPLTPTRSALNFEGPKGVRKRAPFRFGGREMPRRFVCVGLNTVLTVLFTDVTLLQMAKRRSFAGFAKRD